MLLDRRVRICGGRVEPLRPLTDLDQHLAEVSRDDVRRDAPHLADDVVRHASSPHMVVLPIHGNAWVTRVRPKSAALLCATNSLRSGFSHHALDHVRGPGVRSSWRVSGANPSFGCGKGGESRRPWRGASCQTCPRIPPVAVRAGHLVRLAPGESWSRQEGKWSGANAPSGSGSVMGRSSSPRLSVAPAPWRAGAAFPPAPG